MPNTLDEEIELAIEQANRASERVGDAERYAREIVEEKLAEATAAWEWVRSTRLRLIADLTRDGLTAREIADRVGLSRSTVLAYRRTAFAEFPEEK